METDPCGEENKEPAREPKVMAAISRLADEDSPTELPHGPAETPYGNEEEETESCAGMNENTEIKSPSDSSELESRETELQNQKRLRKTNSWKMVRFQDPSAADAVLQRDSSVESLFPEYAIGEWTSSTFEELFMAEDWEDITDDRLLRKKVLQPGTPEAPCPTWGQEITVKMQCVLEDHTAVEKDSKLIFVIGEGDVNQALEECTISMQKDEIALLLADSQYSYGLLGR
ncbi:hypothetical protein LDENG_00104480 [Lucifuga dentata]|nr:hypothetical protein LDENG_00104480 [Lucifuga dentata]